MGDSFAGRYLRAARIEADLSQRALAVAAGLPRSTVGRIERGRVSPRVDTFMRLLEAAGVDAAVDAFMDLDKGRPEIEEMLKLTPTQRVERLMVEVSCAQVLTQTITRVRRVSEERRQSSR